MSIFQTISTAFQSINTTCTLANAQAKAYDPNTPTFGPDDQASISPNMAGVYAADSAANAIAALRSPQIVNGPATVTEEAYKAALSALANDDLDAVERYVARQFANATRRAGQPFRGLQRLMRSANAQFNTLPENEVAKDDAQLVAAARSLLNLLQ